MKDTVRILVINTGSTSTKLAVYENDKEILSESLDHSVQELESNSDISSQLEFRKRAVFAFLKKNGIDGSNIDVIASRGGAFEIFHGGAYLIDRNIAYLASTVRPGFNFNASWTAASVSYELAEVWGIKAYFYNAVFTDELCDAARYSGISFIKRRAGGHPLNTKEVCRRVACSLGRKVDECSFIACHLGGGISSELHVKGRIVDVQTFTEGTFTPERAGRVPSNSLIDLFYSGRFPDKKSFMRFMRGKGGLVDYLGTNSLVEVEARIENGDSEAENVLHAMAYQVSKDIGTLAAAAKGEIDRIVLTGGMAHSRRLTSWIKEYVSFIAPVEVMAGSFEMEALAAGILRVYREEEGYSLYSETEIDKETI